MTRRPRSTGYARDRELAQDRGLPALRRGGGGDGAARPGTGARRGVPFGRPIPADARARSATWPGAAPPPGEARPVRSPKAATPSSGDTPAPTRPRLRPDPPCPGPALEGPPRRRAASSLAPEAAAEDRRRSATRAGVRTKAPAPASPRSSMRVIARTRKPRPLGQVCVRSGKAREPSQKRRWLKAPQGKASRIAPFGFLAAPSAAGAGRGQGGARRRQGLRLRRPAERRDPPPGQDPEQERHPLCARARGSHEPGRPRGQPSRPRIPAHGPRHAVFDGHKLVIPRAGPGSPASERMG